MLSKITVWGDSILKGIVLDEQKGRYVPLRDQSCLALTAKRLGIEISNHAHFGMTSEKGRLLVQRGLQQAKEEGAQAGLIGFGGNDIDYNWRAISEHPEEEHLPNTPPEQFRRNVEEMIELHERAGIMPGADEPAAHRRPPLLQLAFQGFERKEHPAVVGRCAADLPQPPEL